jgi:phosphatidylserine/phosphatidylglycerophosphate/cardiolipin synthase-like enzyme
VYLSPRMLHTKMIITENFISFGSTNITKKAFHQLDELNLFVKNKPFDFCDAVYADVQYNLAKAQRITSHRDVNYRRWVAFLEGFLV